MTDLDFKPGETWLRHDGGKARIYATDGAGLYPVHGAVESDNGWSSEVWTEDGKFLDNVDLHDYDLIRRVDWRADLAPIWAALRPEYRWVAMNDYGLWCAYKKKPIPSLDTGQFFDDGDRPRVELAGFYMPTPDCDWTKTLTERPEGM